MKDQVTYITPKVSTLLELVHVDTMSVKKGVYTARLGYFYTHGGTHEKFAAHIKESIPGAEIIESWNHWATFRGGASTANSSHWGVKFRIRALENKLPGVGKKVP